MPRIVSRPALDAVFPDRPHLPFDALIEALIGPGPGYTIKYEYFSRAPHAFQVWWARTLCNALRKGWTFGPVNIQGAPSGPDGFRFWEGEAATQKRRAEALATIKKYLKDVKPIRVDPTTLTEEDWREIEGLALQADQRRARERAAGRK